MLTVLGDERDVPIEHVTVAPGWDPAPRSRLLGPPATS